MDSTRPAVWPVRKLAKALFARAPPFVIGDMAPTNDPSGDGIWMKLKDVLFIALCVSPMFAVVYLTKQMDRDGRWPSWPVITLLLFAITEGFVRWRRANRK